ncbi:MAG: hypothetical protein DWQ41_15015 [Planctomycetota bacterium]|nr:MAG: hypothetical protein DWQ41_15015 [Planctomycetota bacterium]
MLRTTLMLSGVAALTALLALFGNDYGTKIEIGSGELYYTDNVEEAEAVKLGDYLETEVEYFSGDPRTVQLDRTGGSLVVRFCVQDGAWDDSQATRGFTAMEALLSTFVFEDENVVVELCDDVMETRYVIEGVEPSPGDLIDTSAPCEKCGSDCPHCQGQCQCRNDMCLCQ